ncbi:MAG: hypothetical protein U0183_35410 [Polyangiaceae bacterium]
MKPTPIRCPGPLAGLLVGLALTAAAREGLAAPCSTLGAQPVVYVENGDTQEPLLKRLGYALARTGAPLRIVYKNLPTCTLAADMYGGKSLVNDATGARPIRYVPMPAEDPTWDPKMPSPTCEADDPGGHPIGLGIGATYLSSCPTLPAKPADLAVTNGPIQAYGLIVPLASPEVAITAEEGYFAYGFPAGEGMASPWLDQALRFSRGPTASTALTLAAAMGLRASALRGTVPANNTSSEVLALLAASPNPSATIGLMGTEVYDTVRERVKLLAFRALGQRYAYFPDTSATSFDKRNVRDGHYLPWSPTPYIARVDGAGIPVDANVRRVFELVLGMRVEPGLDGLDAVTASGLVPECAMRVTRAGDGADLALFSAKEPCGCAFEAKVPGGSTTCAACSDTTPCAAGVCRHGYCEAR